MNHDSSAPAPKVEGEEDGDSIDVALMMRVKERDTEAFEELIGRHKGSIIGTVYRMLNDMDEAHDIAQKVFIRIWNSAPRYKVSAKFTTWMFTITKNLVYNETRRRKRRPHYSLEAQVEENHLSMPDKSALLPSDSLLHQEMTEAIEAAMTRLPERQRIALVLRRFEHLSYEEIAEIMQLTVSSVKSLLFRARTQLRDELRSYLDDEEPIR